VDYCLQTSIELPLKCQASERTNDDEWHTVYVRRRADFLQAWVDDCRKVPGSLCLSISLAFLLFIPFLRAGDIDR